MTLKLRCMALKLYEIASFIICKQAFILLNVSIEQMHLGQAGECLTRNNIAMHLTVRQSFITKR